MIGGILFLYKRNLNPIKNYVCNYRNQTELLLFKIVIEIIVKYNVIMYFKIKDF